MTREQAKYLRIGDRVIYSDGVQGTVEEKFTQPHYPSIGQVRIKWEDGQDGWIHFDDMANIREV